MRIIKHLVLAAFIVLPGLLLAQPQEKKERKASFIVSTDVLHYLNDIYRIDIEGKKTNSCLSHFLSVEFLDGNTNNNSSWLFSNGTDPISGFGLGIHQKWVLRKGNFKSTPYVAYGIGLRKASIRYSAVGFSRYIENSLDYYTYGAYDDEIEIKSGFANVIGGLQLIHSTKITFDGYVGFAYKFSDSESQKHGSKEYNRSSSSFAYEGPAFQLGAKLGFKIY